MDLRQLLLDARLGLEIGALVISCLLVGFASLAEAAVLSANRARIHRLAEQGHRQALVLRRLQERSQEFLIVSIALLNLGMVVSAFVFVDLVKLLGYDAYIGYAIAGMVIVLLVFFEVIPKTRAVYHAERTALAIARPVWALYQISHPVAHVLFRVSRFLVRWVYRPLLGGRAEPRHARLTGEELKLLVEAGQETGDIEAHETEMIHGAIELGDKVAREVMTPRTNMVSVAEAAPVDEAARLMLQHGHSRLPAFGASSDDIRGIVIAPDVVDLLRTGQGATPVATALRPTMFVPESKNVGQLLQEMQREGVRLAVVIDEYGGTAGIVTTEDVLEEIVGEIADEYDPEPPMVQMLDRQTALVDARAPAEELSERFDVTLPEGDYDSIGGLILELLGHFPKAGEEVECAGLRFRIERVDPHRIALIRVTRLPAAADGEAG